MTVCIQSLTSSSQRASSVAFVNSRIPPSKVAVLRRRQGGLGPGMLPVSAMSGLAWNPTPRVCEASDSAVARSRSKPRVLELEAHKLVAELGEEEGAEEQIVAAGDDGLHA